MRCPAGVCSNQSTIAEASSTIIARHARQLADNGDPDGADAEWNEAVEQACLARIYGDAANWLYSQRMLATRCRPVLSDPYGQLASALSAESGQPTVAGAAPSAREHALEDLQDGKLRAAAIRLQRYLRDSAASASWVDEHMARRMLADVGRQRLADVALDQLDVIADSLALKDLAELLRTDGDRARRLNEALPDGLVIFPFSDGELAEHVEANDLFGHRATEQVSERRPSHQ